MKHLLLTVGLVLTTTGLVASTTVSIGTQTNSSGTRQSSAVAIYGRRCASCHGKDGRANTAKGKLRSARDLTDPQWQNEVSDERIFNSITNGKGMMPGFAKNVSESETNALVSYVRRLKK